MVLYESHSVIHGRPFPLEGKYFANVFIHFEPIGPLDADPDAPPYDKDIPPYLIPGSQWEETWRENNPDGWSIEDSEDDDEYYEYSEDQVRKAAIVGDVETLEDVGEIDPNFLHLADELGWHRK